MRVSSIRWGVILIGIGLFFLGINLRLLDSLVFPKLFSLWPILLIAIGVELIFRRTRFYFLALLSPILIAAAFIYVASSSGDWRWRADEFWSNWSWNGGNRQTFTFELDPDSSVKALNLDLYCGPAEISIYPSPSKIFKVDSDYFKKSPMVRDNTSGDAMDIEYTNRERTELEVFGWHMSRARSKFELSADLPVRARITTSAGEPDLNFAGLKITELDVNLNSSSSSIRLGNAADSVDLIISGDSDRLKLIVPRDFGLSFSGNQARLEKLLKDIALSPSSEGFMSSGYNESSRKIHINLEARINSLSISRD